jgi:hypothetical protein
MVVPDCAPVETLLVELLAQNPRADADRGAGHPEVSRLDSERAELRQPARIDLHEADVDGAIGILVERARVEPGLDLGDAVQDVPVGAVLTAGFSPACGCRAGRKTQYGEKKGGGDAARP